MVRRPTVAGYVLALLLLFRLLWGFVGSAHSRFAGFLYSPRSVASYVSRLIRLDPPSFIGHNPLGGWMVLLMLVVLVGTVVTGLLSGDEHGPGGLLLPLIAAPGEEGLGELHEVLANVILVLASLHILGLAADWILTRENIVRAMITGNKTVEDTTVVPTRHPVAGWRALAVAVLVALAGFALFSRTDFASLSVAPPHSGAAEDEHGG